MAFTPRGTFTPRSCFRGLRSAKFPDFIEWRVRGLHSARFPEYKDDSTSSREYSTRPDDFTSLRELLSNGASTA